ncbi:hypothetical protein R1sor_010116 [Riccia sorocarpa]|uniref:Uncharacterized protein n=1 Tax=Riccia sorocarpa TaxID=122646 RepID=A0ABD3I0M6_9MARC
MRWRTIQHVDRYGRYEPPAARQASTSTSSPFDAIFLEDIVQQAVQQAMDQLAERLSIETHIVRGIRHLRWIVKESTIPNTGLSIFALERVVVQPDTHPDDYPQLFSYVDSVYKRKQYKVMLRHMPHFIDYILDTSPNVPGGPQKRRYIDGDPNKGFHIMTVATRTIEPGEEGFDPPEVEAFSWRAQRRIQSIHAAGVGVEDEDNAEDEVEDEVLEDVPEAYIPEEELQDQAIMAEFFNMRYEPTSDTGKEHSSQLDEDACTPLFEDARLSKLTAILLLSNLQ